MLVKSLGEAIKNRRKELDITQPHLAELAQISAWQFTITHLKQLSAALPDAHFFMEFAIPRMGRRADAVIVAGPLILVLEYKVGERAFARHAIEQAHGYALDLKNFHVTSHDKAIIPILIAAFAAYALSWMQFPGRSLIIALVVGLIVVVGAINVVVGAISVVVGAI